MPYFLVLQEGLPQTYHHYRIGHQPRRGVQLLSPIRVTHCCFSWDQARSHLLPKCQLGSIELSANKLDDGRLVNTAQTSYNLEQEKLKIKITPPPKSRLQKSWILAF